ncbi:bolA-like protein DDB_G0274169 [Leptopilina boulardi]|uniref:bolA-like protein DDB_G0274169 n=1 Tax=Leptopilina boulardi TaxID=63433 RepID=UPI0021F537AE|nr:bolA-like protein DDB_G0274169 [Leptopilina boulardi]XP_051174164.1 bolA-like protein DDB_G0274169 [Leptopilina boulardi]
MSLIFGKHCRFNVRLFLRTMVNSGEEKPTELSIRKKLQDALNPKHLEILNESYMHNVPKGSETHFKVLVVSDKFNDQTLIKRHRTVNDILKEELASGVHALSIVAKTPDQWEDNAKTISPSPQCRGGFGK